MRRKFYEARAQAPKVAGWFLQHFQNLYALEAQLRETRAGPKLRQAQRASLSRPVLARLHRALVRLKTRHRFLPRSIIGQAIDYALDQWPSLLIFLEDGRLEIDNNLIENAIRPTAIGKKNWLFIPSAALRAPAVRPRLARAAPSSTPSSNVAGGAASIPSPTSATCSPGSSP